MLPVELQLKGLRPRDYEETPTVQASGNITLLKIKQLCRLLGLEAEGASTIDLRRETALSAKNAGFLIVPDIVHDPVYGEDENMITLVPIGEDEFSSPSYMIAHLTVELGMITALSDGAISESEMIQLSFIMERHFDFTELDIRALSALKDFSILYPPDMELTVKRLTGLLPMDKCRQIAKLMTTIAAAGGQIARKKTDGLKKLFEILGMNEEDLNETIKELQILKTWILVKGTREEETEK
jgi:uncharacterized tellurite resistance protein B-like protein